jgi:predicted RNA-binding Zn-ribbon protein involved in translation (DUF1610 family)
LRIRFHSASGSCVGGIMEWLTAEFQRVFVGDKPLLFLVEVAFRTTFIFSYTLLLLRWMGKRGLGQLSPFEFAIIIALGSAVGDPMFYGDVPLLHAMLVIAIIVGLHQLLGTMTQNHRTLEEFIESRSELLVQCGCVDIAQLERERISVNELFEMLRLEGISHLGQVRQAFLEPSGRLSVIRWFPSRPGLSVLPDPNHAPDFEELYDSNWLCCASCGAAERSGERTITACPNCGSTAFRVARTDCESTSEN